MKTPEFDNDFSGLTEKEKEQLLAIRRLRGQGSADDGMDVAVPLDTDGTTAISNDAIREAEKILYSNSSRFNPEDVVKSATEVIRNARISPLGKLFFQSELCEAPAEERFEIMSRIGKLQRKAKKALLSEKDIEYINEYGEPVTPLPGVPAIARCEKEYDDFVLVVSTQVGTNVNTPLVINCFQMCVDEETHIPRIDYTQVTVYTSGSFAMIAGNSMYNTDKYENSVHGGFLLKKNEPLSDTDYTDAAVTELLLHTYINNRAKGQKEV